MNVFVDVMLLLLLMMYPLNFFKTTKSFKMAFWVRYWNYIFYLLRKERRTESKFAIQIDWVQGSISPMFYAQLLRQQSWASKVQTLSVSIKKLCMQLTYVKAARRMLVKLTPGYIIISSWTVTFYGICNNEDFFDRPAAQSQ